MTELNLTDREVEKALVCCAVLQSCRECPAVKDKTFCTQYIMQQAHSIIKRIREESANQSENFSKLTSDHILLQNDYDHIKRLFEESQKARENWREEFVRKCLEIAELKARLKATIAGQETLQKALKKKIAEYEALKADEEREHQYCRNVCEPKYKAEIEMLSDRNHKCIYLSDDQTTAYCVDGPCPKFKTEAQIRVDAFEEFAERLKSEYTNDKRYDRPNAHTLLVCLFGKIDSILKEKVGEA